MHDNPPNVARIFEAYLHPGLTGIHTAPRAIAVDDVSSKRLLVTTRINEVQIRWCQDQSANRSSKKVIRDRLPVPTAILGPPNASTCGSHVKEVRIRGYSCNARCPSTACRPYVSILEHSEHGGIDSSCRGERWSFLLLRFAFTLSDCCFAYAKTEG